MRRTVWLVLLCFLLADSAPALQRGFAGRFGGGGVRIGGGFGHFGFRVGGFHRPGFGHFRGFHRPGFHRPFFGSRIVVRPFGHSPFFRQRMAFGAFGYPGFSYGGFYSSAIPVFVGGGSAYGVPAAPNVTIIYLPPPEADRESSEVRQREQPSAEPRATEAKPDDAEEPIRFLIPLKDSRVHVAAAYWVVGDTVHFIDSRGKRMSVALDQVDRGLAEKLNRGQGVEFGLPKPKPR